MILTTQAADTRHPAFNKLFIESEFVPELNLQVFMRRARSNGEKIVYMGHMLIMDDNQVLARHEADRYRFIGRDRTMQNPAVLHSEAYLTGTSGATLDPIFSLGLEVKIIPHTSTNLAYHDFCW